jgi:hypothetical protein
VNGWWLRAALAGGQCAPAALILRFKRLLNFTVDGTVGAHGAFSASAVRSPGANRRLCTLDQGARKLGC